MYIGGYARTRPEHPALIDSGTGQALSYRELDQRSNRLAQLLFAEGLRRGDGIALFMENNPRYLEIVWAALRSGLYITTINRYLTAGEAAYIVSDSNAKVLIASAARADRSEEHTSELQSRRDL